MRHAAVTQPLPARHFLVAARSTAGARFGDALFVPDAKRKYTTVSRSRFRAALALPATAALALSAFAVPASAVETADKSSLVINEVVSNEDPVGDWVELANLDNNQDLDISGWKVLDNKDDHTPIVFPEGTNVCLLYTSDAADE